MAKKIFILLGHVDKDTACGHFATVYENTAREAGHEVRRTNLGEMKFDPILHHGYKEIQQLEPDLLKYQDDVRWADHLVIVYPNWWSSMPALLKGLFDRAFLPGFAYHFNKTHTNWQQLLKGKTGRVIVTMDNWPCLARFMFGDYTNEIRKAILGFAGVHPVRINKIGPMHNMTPKRIASWESKIKAMARAGK